MSGYASAELEVHKRVLRVKAQGHPTRVPCPSRWTPGTGPTVRVGGTPGPELALGPTAPEARVDAAVPSWRQPSALPPSSAGSLSSLPPPSPAPVTPHHPYIDNPPNGGRPTGVTPVAPIVAGWRVP
jgi:hypothetical protein